MQEKGIPLVPSQRDMTPFQRQFLLSEYTRQEQEAQDEAQEGQHGPPTINGGRTNQRRKPKPGSQAEAIKQSQEETIRYVNKSIVNDE